eukprot:1137243-Pelagomonas_calceolata.AAC.5
MACTAAMVQYEDAVPGGNKAPVPIDTSVTFNHAKYVTHKACALAQGETPMMQMYCTEGLRTCTGTVQNSYEANAWCIRPAHLALPCRMRIWEDGGLFAPLRWRFHLTPGWLARSHQGWD